MTREFEKANFDRRKVLILGLAGASTLVLGQRGSALAQRIEEKGAVARKEFKPVESMIPGFPKVRVREVTYQPGASSKARMQNPMICECTQGAFEVAQDGRKFTAKKGDIWTCNVGTVEENANNGTGPATMRVFDLLPA